MDYINYTPEQIETAISDLSNVQTNAYNEYEIPHHYVRNSESAVLYKDTVSDSLKIALYALCKLKNPNNIQEND